MTIECQFHLTKFSEREGGNLPNIICYKNATRVIGCLQDMTSFEFCEEHFQLVSKKIDEMEKDDLRDEI